MAKYRFTYTQLIETYNSLTIGKIEPTRMVMSRRTFSEFRDWAETDIQHGYEWVRTYPMRFQSATIETSEWLADGCIVFEGGAHFMKLEEVDG